VLVSSLFFERKERMERNKLKLQKTRVLSSTTCHCLESKLSKTGVDRKGETMQKEGRLEKQFSVVGGSIKIIGTGKEERKKTSRFSK